MVTDVRVALATIVLVLGVAATPSIVLAHSKPKNPTKGQIRHAVQSAERSKDLWATVNICDTRKFPNTLGIRGQMPTLRFPAWLSMKVQLNYYNKTTRRYVRDPGVAKLVRLGRWSTGLQQDGVTFSFEPHTGLLNATVTFFWRRAGHLLGEVTRTTTAGHRDADFGNPPHYTTATCRIR